MTIFDFDTMDDAPETLDAHEAAELLGVSEAALVSDDD